MSETIQYEVLGEIAGMQADRAASRFLLMSEDGLLGALARREGDRFIVMNGPFSFDTIRQCAENILAGNARAITWPEAQIAMAIGCACFFTLATRRAAAMTPAAECPLLPDPRTIPVTSESGFVCTPCGG